MVHDRRWALAALAATLLTAGCHRKIDPPRGEVRGHILPAGKKGPAAEPGDELILTSVDDPGVFFQAPIEPDGTFRFVDPSGRGVPVGRYAVSFLPSMRVAAADRKAAPPAIPPDAVWQVKVGENVFDLPGKS